MNMVEKVARALCDDTLTRWRSPIALKPEPWREFIPAARAAIEAGMDWQPIETAPKDGTELLLYGESWRRGVGYYAKGRHIGWYDRGAWSTRDSDVLCVATQWMALPEPPA